MMTYDVINQLDAEKINKYIKLNRAFTYELTNYAPGSYNTLSISFHAVSIFALLLFFKFHTFRLCFAAAAITGVFVMIQ